MSAQPKRLLTAEEYLVIERASPTKHEFYRGEMFAMAGAGTAHNQITFNLAGALHAQLASRPCVACLSDMRVKVMTSGLYTYPDVVVTCRQPQFEDKVLDTLLNPQVIIEVLSESTEKYDRGKKFELYRELESLQEVLLIAHDHAHVDHLRRRDDGVWTSTSVRGLEAVVHMPTIDCRLKLADVYAKVVFPPEDELNRAAGLLTRDELA